MAERGPKVSIAMMEPATMMSQGKPLRSSGRVTAGETADMDKLLMMRGHPMVVPASGEAN
ncbi:hypothetical protein EMEDMD4_90152 [Sinorhizobium medicae]|uniref:Uncharacterized protein n=1 Tax=Sinorhizobium medicae TaxID=110321 RepID=A0A508X7I7_9HYPH|nr:hypothetical protein EMEDMD4_90152 [Sinorhizobium medicae]